MPQLLRVLFDHGSQIFLITEEAAQKLGLLRQKIRAEIAGIDDNETRISKWKIKAQIKPPFPSKFILNSELLILPKSTTVLLIQPLPDMDTDRWQNNILADPTYNESGPIDILVGANEYEKIILEGLKTIESGLIGQDTEFGWILSGQIQRSNQTSSSDKITIAHVDEVRKEVSTLAHPHPGDQTCEEVYKETTTKHEDGRDTVRFQFENAEENP
ncbi:hypothetical protein JTB14_011153 [Gonioctena quinquepunctata]|nr:hypothetical protein JTB14_011153 [Gonioctena quinquepunctata]